MDVDGRHSDETQQMSQKVRKEERRIFYLMNVDAFLRSTYDNRISVAQEFIGNG